MVAYVTVALSVGLKRLEGVSEVGASVIANGGICHGCFIGWFEKVGGCVRGWGNFNREWWHISNCLSLVFTAGAVHVSHVLFDKQFVDNHVICIYIYIYMFSVHLRCSFALFMELCVVGSSSYLFLLAGSHHGRCKGEDYKLRCGSQSFCSDGR